jgi:hypothetical protein
VSRYDFSVLKLPPGWQWDNEGSDYRKFSHPHGMRGAVGGVLFAVSPQDQWQGILRCALMKACKEHYQI